jgi:hypothetical protein
MTSFSSRERQPRFCRPTGSSRKIEKLRFSGEDVFFARTFLEISDSGGGDSLPAVLSVGSLEQRLPGVPPACRAQGFVVRIDEEGIELFYESRTGLIGGLLFLQDCLDRSGEGLAIDTGLYIDWPDVPVRGWFLECGYGTDWMTLDDWKEQIGRMVRLRLNLLGMGLYGCWCHRYDGLPEFLMTPVAGYEGLKSRIVIRTADGRILREGCPEMFEGDFLARVVEHAVENGLQVMPMVNLLGHNTLIPRLLPEVSAKTPDGKPKGYGFCTEEPATRNLVSQWLRGLAERHFPSENRAVFCIGMDEMMELSGIDPHDLDKIVSPWCECSKCRQRGEGDRLVEWIVFLVKLLTDLGFERVSVYHDECQKNGLFPQLFAALRKMELADRLIVIHWNYSADPQPRHQGGESWIMPTTGLFGHMAPSVKLGNIEKSVEQGTRQGFTGVVSYNLIDDGYDRAERYFSALTWNRGRFASREEFTAAYCSRLPQPESAMRGFAAWDAIWDSDFPAGIVEQLFYYFHGYWCWRIDYPAGILALLSSEGGISPRSMAAAALRHLLDKAAALAASAARDFSRSGILEAENGSALRFDLDRTHHVLEMFRSETPWKDAVAQVDSLIQQAILAKPKYLAPYYERELSYIRQGFASLKKEPSHRAA